MNGIVYLDILYLKYRIFENKFYKNSKACKK